MPVETQPTTPTTPNTAAEGTPPPASSAVVVPPAVSAPSAPATPTPAPTADPAKPEIQLSSEQFKDRLERHTGKFLRDKFGTDNVDEIMATYDNAKKLQAAEDERRRASLSAEQKLQEDVARERARADQAEAKAKRLQENIAVGREQRRVTSIAAKFIDRESLDLALIKFAQAVQQMPRKQVARFTDTDMSNWFKEFAKNSPKHARVAPPKTVPRQASSGPTNGPGANAGRPPQDSTKVTPQEKTARPGQPNSMSKKEIRERFGVTW